ncbi:MAG: 5'-nucleotidase C-terminal domain-containing protein, partial [Betaproteobacteria bacterium]|nr:5'-nucleotidase C-terminal domain-containing protein [Betaproteobacteria bacterium]
QGGDMVRVGGLTYAIDPLAPIGSRIFDLRLNGLPLRSDKRYKVAGWAPVTDEEDAKARRQAGEPIWDLLIRHLRGRKSIRPLEPFMPRIVGIRGNPGMAADT